MSEPWRQKFERRLSALCTAGLLLAGLALALEHYDERVGAPAPGGPSLAATGVGPGLSSPWPANRGLFYLSALGLGGLSALGLLIGTWRLQSRNQALEETRERLTREAAWFQRLAEMTERRARHLLDDAGDAIFLIDPRDGLPLEVNRRAEELLGYKAQEIRSLSLSVLFPGRQRRRYLHLVRNVLEHGYAEEGELVFRRKDGSLFTGAVHARLGELGEERVVHGVFRDVTPIKRIELELRRKNHDLLLLNEIVHLAAGGLELEAMLEAVLDRIVQAFAADGGGIYLAGEDGRDFTLKAWRSIDEEVLAEIRSIPPGTGLAGRVAASGRPGTSADVQRDGRLFSQAVRRAGWRGFQAVPITAKDRPTGVLFLFYRASRVLSREEIELLLTLCKQFGSAVERAGLFQALQWQHRLTQASNRELERSRRQLRESLTTMEQANRSLERLDRMKSNFLGLASHELRTPLTCILSGTELLGDQLGDRLSETEKRVLAAIHDGGRRLEGIVQDLLEVARIEARSIYLARERIEMGPLLESLLREFEILFIERSLSFRGGPFSADMVLLGDPVHLRKTFHRLLENAVKFTPGGGSIELSAAIVSPGELRPAEALLRPFAPGFFRNPSSGPLLQVTVRDNGVGIDPEEQLRIFDKFYEVGDINDHSTSRTRFGGKGVGLGLTLVKGMIEAHGGMVWVESPGAGKGGSAFHVLLPLALSDSAGEVRSEGVRA